MSSPTVTVQLGLKIVIYTGDNRRIAESVARELGIHDFTAEVMPQGKIDLVRSSNHKASLPWPATANDAPALA